MYIWGRVTGHPFIPAFFWSWGRNPSLVSQRSTMPPTKGKWVKIGEKGAGPGERSSHAITALGRKIYVFGGEFAPRVPVDNKLHVFSLDDLTWSVAIVSGDIPPPRIGVTMAAVGQTIYVFGGRDGEHKELNELYSFDTSTGKWTLLSGGSTGPPNRSYHSTCADDRHVYIFGGCGESGRLNDLWTYDVVDRRWIEHPTAGMELKGRGGAGLAVAEGKIWVVYGFAGMEMDDVHCFDLANEKWAQMEPRGEKPTARSVFSTVAIGNQIIIYGGEVDPSDQGHLGAGKFSGAVYALDVERLDWKRLVESGADHHPGPRGWCAFAGGHLGQKVGLFVFGGNSPSNDRLGGIFFFSPVFDDNL